MLGIGCLRSLFDQEREHTRVQSQSAESTGAYQVGPKHEAWNRQYEWERKRREEKVYDQQNFWETLGELFQAFYPLVLVIAVIVAVAFGLTKITKDRSTPTTQPGAILSTPGPATPHYTMNPQEWEEYRYQQTLKEIDDRVAVQRMHNASLVAARQAVVECRGGTEWIALAVPGAQFVGTGVPCSAEVKP